MLNCKYLKSELVARIFLYILVHLIVNQYETKKSILKSIPALTGENGKSRAFQVVLSVLNLSILTMILTAAFSINFIIDYAS